MTNRFDRQTRFAGLGEQGQRRLAEARVLVVGCGALGGAAAQWLARAGIGELRLVDRDIVELSNLPRQVLFSEEDAREGRPKADAAARALAAAGGPTRVEAFAEHVDARALGRLGGDVDLIVDGTDNMATRYLINDHCVKHGIPWIYGGVVSGAGLAMAVHPGEGPCLRCVFRDPPPPGSLPTCDTAGVIGPAVGLVASMQAGLALRLLGGTSPPPAGALLQLDAWGGDVRRLDVPRDDACPTCGAGGSYTFLEGDDAEETVSLCGRNTVQVFPPAGAPRLDGEALAARLREAGLDPLAVGPILRFEADGHRFTVFPDGRTLVEGTEDGGRARSLVARWIAG